VGRELSINDVIARPAIPPYLPAASTVQCSAVASTTTTHKQEIFYILSRSISLTYPLSDKLSRLPIMGKPPLHAPRTPANIP
jgi:hypothetical protein